MTDDIILNLYNKKLKPWIKKYYKPLIVILLYLLYMTNFLSSILSVFGLKLHKFPRYIRISFLVVNDLIYIIALFLLYRKEIKEGIKKFKKDKINNINLSLKCWIVGSIIMALSTFIINLITKQNLSANEEAVRESIKLAPLFMLFEASILAPLFEELVFRRSIRYFVKRKWLYVLASGISFGLLHVLGSPNLASYLFIIPYSAMGCCFAYLYYKTDNITLPMGTHMLHNFILVLMQIIRG